MNENNVTRLEKIPILRNFIHLLRNIKSPRLEGFSLYDLLYMYIKGIINGAFTYHASAVAFSFFMALFPFALFILNLIPYIPIEGFESDFLNFVRESVPPNTYDAIANIINDILNNSHSGLLSTGFVLSIIFSPIFYCYCHVNWYVVIVTCNGCHDCDFRSIYTKNHFSRCFK